MTAAEPLYTSSPVVALADVVAPGASGRGSQVVLRTGGGSATALVLAPGGGLPEHAAPAEALAVVTHGEARFTMDGQPHVLPAGSAIRLPAGRPHTVEAPGGCRLLLVVLRDP